MRLSRFVGVAVLMAVFTGAATRAEAQTGFVIQSINLTGVNLDAATGVLTGTGGTVSGLLEGVQFTTNITNFVLSPGGSCAILDLDLAPIHISLLGLHIDTSAICLTITAQGPGILGQLLCDLAGAGGVLGTINGILNSTDFLSSLSDILNQALSQGQNVPPRQRATVCTGRCRVLDLVIGPLTLNLLGVQVDLNNCSKGPVEVCVSATARQGLLGEVLCDLAGQGLTLQDIATLIANVLAGL